MASKFFAAEGSQSEEEESQHSSEEEEKVEDKPAKRPMYFESSSDEEEKRVIKSQKDKRFDALHENIKKIKEKMRIEDFASLADEFDELNKNYEKAKKVIEKEGIPLFYTRICFVLDAFVNNYTPEKKKALKPANNKGFNALKMKLKKNNKNIAPQLEEFAKNPVFSEDEKPQKKGKKADDSEDESEEESESDDDKKKKTTKTKKAAAEESDDSSDWSESGSESEDDDEDDDEDDLKKYLQSSDPQVRRNYWLLRPDKEGKEKEDKDAKKKKRKEEQIARAQARKARAYDDTHLDKVAKEKVNYTAEGIDRRIKEIIDKRAGKKSQGKDKRGNVDEDLESLQDFLNDSKDNSRRLEILMILLPTRFDYAKSINSSYMIRNLWLESIKNLQELFRLIRTKDRINMAEIRNFQKDSDPYYKDTAIIESFSTHFDGLDNELYKAFKFLENSDREYYERLKDQASLYKLAKEALEYYEFVKDEANTTKFAFKIIEYTYSVSDSVLEKMRQVAKEQGLDIKGELYAEENTQKLIHDLATRIYRSSDNKLKVLAMLYQIYHHCINGRYQIAKDYLLMSHIPDFAQNSDLSVQIIYNRALIQLGLCAFREGLLIEAHQALSELCSTGRIRELLAQAVSKYPVNEKEERRRLLPYHLHINIEMIEAIYLTASMLIEVPYIASDPYDAKTRNISRSFRRLYDMYKHMYGPSENYKDSIIVAGRELIRGNWKKSYEHLLKIKIWQKLPCDIEKTKQNLLEKVKEQAFKSYLFSFQSCYDSLDLDRLAVQFELTKEVVQSSICKLVCSRELRAFLDVDNNCLVFQRDETTKLESQAMQLSDRITTMLMNNEKIMDAHFGNYGYSDKDLVDNGFKGKRPFTKKKANILKNKKGGKRRN